MGREAHKALNLVESADGWARRADKVGTRHRGMNDNICACRTALSPRRGRGRLLRLALALLLSLLSAAATAGAFGARGTAAEPSSLTRAYEFLEHSMDRYASGSQLRLVQSFTGGPLEKQRFTDSVTYDDALMVDAFLARGGEGDLARAEVVGDSLLYAQQHDPADDGRVRAAYAPSPLRESSDLQITDATSDVGNMAWVGQALVQLYRHTSRASYLAGARAIGAWIQANDHDTRGAGGYTGGMEANGRRITWKSAEHNVDLYSLFSLLAAATGEASWTADAAWARGFVEAMWEPSRRMFWVGTGPDGATINRAVLAEDVNSWTYLALHDVTYAGSIDWDLANLAVSRAGFSGVSFCRGARSGVWFEGTAHLADALLARSGPGDAVQAHTLLSDIAHAQDAAPNADGLGVVAASRKLSNCEGEPYFPSLHTGASAWYVLALQGTDPFAPIP
jgi:hypothetical protein